jgi:hypothetical protein
LLKICEGENIGTVVIYNRMGTTALMAKLSDTEKNQNYD